MKCPYCDYIYESSSETEFGNFYRLPHPYRAVRSLNYIGDNKSVAEVCGCPKCTKMFIIPV